MSSTDITARVIDAKSHFRNRKTDAIGTRKPARGAGAD
jgi:hypothetical protein